MSNAEWRAAEAWSAEGGSALLQARIAVQALCARCLVAASRLLTGELTHGCRGCWGLSGVAGVDAEEAKPARRRAGG